MTFYWSLKQVPELTGLSRAERRRVHRACYRQHTFKSPRCIFALVLCGLCGGGGGAIGGLVHFMVGGSFFLWPPALGSALGGGGGGFIFRSNGPELPGPFFL